MMNPVLAEIYSTVLEAAPFVIAAYALIWVLLVVFILVINTGLRKSERNLQLLEERIAQLEQ
jgi:hypothetical protein